MIEYVALLVLLPTTGLARNFHLVTMIEMMQLTWVLGAVRWPRPGGSACLDPELNTVRGAGEQEEKREELEREPAAAAQRRPRRGDDGRRPRAMGGGG
jgi:hypothetical protein